MRAVVYRGKNKIRVEDVAEPGIVEPRDAVVRVVFTTICGTDIHLVNGRLPGMVPGTILGHECVGVVEEVGPGIKNLARGDRVIVLSTVGCGACGYCENGQFSHCENTSVGPSTLFFGGPAEAGSLDGMQAERLRVPFADVTCVKIPGGLDDVAALALSDIFPTAFFGASEAGVEEGHKVVILGAGPVGQMAITSCHMLGAEKIVVIDKERSRLDMARFYPEVEAIDYARWGGPVSKVMEILGDHHGADVVIDCVGIDASNAWGFHSPTKAIEYAVELVRPEGVFSILGVYDTTPGKLPLGGFLSKNVRIVGGNCHHRSHVEEPLAYALAHPEECRRLFTHRAPLDELPEAFDAFCEKEDGMMKCLIQTSVVAPHRGRYVGSEPLRTVTP